VAIIDRGCIVALDSPEQLKAIHGEDGRITLEDVFVKLTGRHLGQGETEP
jgi:hypothetical protein